MSENGRRRLTSWKEIASHLGRDVRTVLRWEKERGLPVRRVPGATGRVVFAYADELDAWSRGELAVAGPPAADAGETAAPPAVSAPVVTRRLRVPRWAVLGVGIVAMVAIAAWQTYASRSSDAPFKVRVDGDALIAVGLDGSERWRHIFHDGEHADLVRYDAPMADLVGGSDPGVLTAVTVRSNPETGSTRSGLLYWFGLDGELRRTAGFDTYPTFNGRTFSHTYALTDYRVDISGTRRVALSAHHYQWWPSLVTVFDERWNRGATFVHAGWIEHVLWMTRDRLLIAGFSNAYEGGVIALLDPAAMDGEGPVPHGEFECDGCGRARPVRYIVMPRSEVNRVGVQPFNRVILDAAEDRLSARTIEVPATPTQTGADAFYEFTRSLDLVHASYSDRYWEEHRKLEAQGRITHTREQCPDRNGPREILVWEPATGWRTIATNR